MLPVVTEYREEHLCGGEPIWNGDRNHYYEVDIRIDPILAKGLIYNESLGNIPEQNDQNPPALNELLVALRTQPASCSHICEDTA